MGDARQAGDGPAERGRAALPTTGRNPSIAFYADDFTGATDAVAQFHRFGLRGLLLIDGRGAAELADGYDVVGVAGVSRSLPTAQMDGEIRPQFEALRRLRPHVVQYKMCSTADSSPHLGSLGRAIEIGREIFGPSAVPVLAAQPEFGRYTAFGHHFAAENGQVYRLDRQPTMSRHPATPMTESDLCVHLGRQTRLPVQLLDVTALDAGFGAAQRRYQEILAERPGAVVFDALNGAHLRTGAALTLSGATGDGDSAGGPAFALGSGGLSYGLGACISGAGAAFREDRGAPLAPAGKVLVVSGSCAARTASQIRWALGNGWTGIDIGRDPALSPPAPQGAPPPEAAERALVSLGERVAEALARSRHGVVVYTSLGPPPAGNTGGGREEPLGLIGRALGHVVTVTLRHTGVRRVIVAGGDTSGRVMRAIGARAVSVDSIVGIGAVVCRAISGDPAVHGAQIMLKGGQVGDIDLFETVRLGGTGAEHARRAGVGGHGVRSR